eukprot:gene3443-3939_t
MIKDMERQPLLRPTSNGNGSASNFLNDLNRSLEDVQQSVERQEINNIEMRFGLTPVRRMFCLLALFDFLFIFLLWIIYAQLFSDDIKVRFQIELIEYDFKKSLFDFVILAFLRCLCLLCVYALTRSSKWYMVAVTTMLTTLMAISKVFCIGKNIKTGQPLSYFIIITTFVICWAEAWHFDFQVIPTEMKMRKDQIASTLTSSLPSIPGPVTQWQQRATSEYQSCYSPVAVTPCGNKTSYPSDSDSNVETDCDYLIDDIVRQKNKANIKKSQEAASELLRMMHISENWQVEKQEKDDIKVDSKTFKNIGKVFRCNSRIDCSSKLLFETLWVNVEGQSVWNPGVVECRVVKRLNKRTDICYVMAAEAAGGLISNRDFVTVRRYERKGAMLLLGGIAVTMDDIPKINGIIRGENGPGGYVIKPIPNDPERCELFWFLNTNLKGWIPQKIIDQSMATVMVDTTRALREHISAIL